MTEPLPVVLQQVRCPRCRKPLELAVLATSPAFRCPLCGRAFETVRFDPRVVQPRVTALATAGPEVAQPCATHARNAAVASCDRCGAFMCSLCRIDFDNRVVCPACFERLTAEGAIESARTRFRDYSGLASLTATAGCLFSMMFLGILLGPLAILYGVKAIRQKKQFGETDGLVGIWVALILGIIETLAGVGVIAFFAFSLFRTTST